MLSEDELIGLLNGHRANAVGFNDSDISQAQKKAMDYYQGEKFGDEEDGRSQVVSKDVAEVIDGTMPDLMRIFASEDNVVFFKPDSEGDVEEAQQRTEYVRHIFYEDNEGFEILYDFAKEGLLQKNGMAKVWWEEKEVQKVDRFGNMNNLDVAILEEEGEIIEEETRPAPPGTEVQFPDSLIYDVTLERTKMEGRARVAAFPSDELLISARATSLDAATYLNHTQEKPLADLVAEDLISEEDALQLSSDTSIQFQNKKDNRYPDQDKKEEPDQGLMREVQVDEEWVIADVDEDGVAERRHIIRVDNEILVNEIVDDHALVDWTPNRMPARFWGRSLADDTMDIQRITSVLLRQMLDNLYLANNPRKYVNMRRAGETTIQDMLNERVGGIIRGDGPMTDAVGEFTTPYVAGSSQFMLDYMDAKKQERTGHFKLTEGLDADTLNPTATGVVKLMAAAQGRKELIARRLALGVAKIFQKLEATVIKYQDFERVVQLRDTFVKVDPRHWNASMRTSIQVGLGTGAKDQVVANLGQIMTLQQQAGQQGYASSQIMREKLFNTFSDLVSAWGFPSVERYMPPPTVPPEEVQSDAEIEAQAELQKIEMQEQTKRQKNQSDAQLKLMELRAEIMLKSQELGIEVDLKMFELETEAFLKGAELAAGDESGDMPNVDTRINDDIVG